MLKKTVRIIIEAISVVSILSMLSAGVFFVWILVAPRSLAFVTPYIEKGLNSISTQFSVKIDSSFIAWDRKQRSIAVHAKNVTIYNETHDSVATLPEISFGFSILRLLRGNLFSSDLTLMHPSIHVNTAEKTLYVTPASDRSLEEFAFKSLYDTLKNRNSSFKIHSIRMEDADIYISTGVSDMLWKVSDGYAKLETSHGINNIKSEFKVSYGKDETYFMLNITRNDARQIDTEIHFKDLPSYTFAELFPDYQLEQKVNMTLSGQSNILVAQDSTISQIRLELDSASGSVDLPDFFKNKIAIKNMKMDANIYNNFSSVAINNLELDLHDSILKLSGNINNSKTWPEVLPSIDMSASVSNVKVSDIARYWPYNFGTIARDWVITNITEGIVTKAEGKFKLTSGDIQNILDREHSDEKDDTPPIPKNAIDASIYVEKAKVSYLENYPVATDAKAVVTFTGQSMDASVESAKMLGTNLTKTHVTFDNLWEHPLLIGVSGNFAGPAQDLIQVLKASYKQTADNAALTSIYNMSGLASGNASLTIPIMKDLKYNDMEIKVSANFKNAFLPGIANGSNLSGLDMNFLLDKYEIEVKGDSLINNIPAKFDYSKNFSGTAAYDTKLKLKGSFSTDDIKELAMVDIPFVSGKIGLDIDLTTKNDSTTIEGTADITQSGVVIQGLGFEKAPGKNGKVSFGILKTAKEISIKDFKLQGDNYTINGSTKLDGSMKGISELTLTRAKFGNNDFSLLYKTSDAGNNIDISGKSLDLSHSKINEWLRQDPGKMKKSLLFSANIATLYMKNGEIIKELSSSLHCSPEICSTGSLYGKLRTDNFIVISLKNIGDRSALLVESDNAGAIINALNISKNITGGHLNIDSTLGRRGGITVAQGVTKISNFTAIRTPLLGKILTLASFRGFEDLLNNQGISFKKFEAPFTMADGVITIQKGKSSGSSIGLTTEGTVDTNKDEVDLKGVIVPAYAVNNILGKIPVVGNIIIGKANEGIIATKYSVKGPYDDAKISVNPLSILTPGFLRNIFDVFD